ncbi:mitochondrial fission ELM1 family protein [Accumulibacter sp.]|uniref:mitochondrial fission ELM1 family protein n=1 Tax=Accumulibacter sp. TaxID=2053492 RepID=UPI0025DF4403|nr:mitochondrial fission ELM1 family protein [Accumulibacter sp.]MCM8593931.1 mitochondrial fission ELM1 family protein [Accumulibacter sp.]MCM8627780.1 mitochondrial fission ELM1 family protein [Accumulibacter sp.]MDS4048072.1 mitochondrial fission ELM1 family protein [Accumulibacter sp.]
MSLPCVIWRVVDGKRGHERQTEGLIRALARLLPVIVREVHALPRGRALWSLVTGRWPSCAEGAQAPDLIVGAGHRTHLTMLAAQRARGGRTIVLMNPSLPRSCFDLCIVPRHDDVLEAANVLLTVGALNAVEPSRELDLKIGLILLGGRSAHYRWDDAAVAGQVRSLCRAAAQVTWRATTSPRTPEATVALLRGLEIGNLQLTAFDEAPLDWLTNQLREAGQVWVSPDSVSMLYEALTSGAAVGVLDLQPTGNGRVVRGVNDLLRDGKVTGYADWLAGRRLQRPAEEFDEAARCARWIRQRWFPDR